MDATTTLRIASFSYVSPYLCQLGLTVLLMGQHKWCGRRRRMSKLAQYCASLDMLDPPHSPLRKMSCCSACRLRVYMNILLVQFYDINPTYPFLFALYREIPPLEFLNLSCLSLRHGNEIHSTSITLWI